MTISNHVLRYVCNVCCNIKNWLRVLDSQTTDELSVSKDSRAIMCPLGSTKVQACKKESHNPVEPLMVSLLSCNVSISTKSVHCDLMSEQVPLRNAVDGSRNQKACDSWFPD